MSVLKLARTLIDDGGKIPWQVTDEPPVNPALVRSIWLKFAGEWAATYEFRGASLFDAVQRAVGRNAPAFELKKLNKARQKFDFAARARLGSALFVGEGNFSFALALARLKG